MDNEERTLIDEIVVIHKLLLIAKEAENLIQEFNTTQQPITNSHIQKMNEYLIDLGCPIDDLVRK